MNPFKKKSFYLKKLLFLVNPILKNLISSKNNRVPSYYLTDISYTTFLKVYNPIPQSSQSERDLIVADRGHLYNKAKAPKLSPSFNTLLFYLSTYTCIFPLSRKFKRETLLNNLK